MMTSNLELFFVLTFFSILGTLARLGCTILSEYPGSYLKGIVWSNFTSCLVMGIVRSNANIWPRDEKAVFVGMTTGFCGTFSSFASFILELFEGSTSFPRSGRGLLQFLSVLLTQLAMSFAAYKFGFSLGVSSAFYQKLRISSGTYGFAVRALASLGSIFLVISVALAGSKPSWRVWTLSMTFSPLGCYLRYVLAKLNKPHKSRLVPDFLGTYLANLLASIIISVLTVLSRASHKESRVVTRIISCEVVIALINGFCAVLSTVSTFVAEACSAEFWDACYYCLGSILTTFAVAVAIVGSVQWSVGFVSPICSV